MLVQRVWPSRPAFENPFGNLERLRGEMLRLFGAADETGGDVAPGVFPPLNVTQDNDGFHLRAEVPGTKASDLSVSALRNRVTISGKRQIPPENERVSYHRRERAEGSFSRTISLPSEIDAERVDARYTDGVLELTLPKADSAKPKQIVVKS
jgi:HSP20 family protein